MTGRFVAGRLHYPSPPEDGTILGPNAFGEYVVVLGTDDGVTELGIATKSELEAAAGKNRSLVEWRGR